MLRHARAVWLEFRVAVEHARAGVPPQDGFVVLRGAQALGVFIVPHRFVEPLPRGLAVARPATHEVRLGFSLADDAAVIRAAVFVAQLIEDRRCCGNGSVSESSSNTNARWLPGSASSTSRQMLSASIGSFNSRYRSTRSSAACVASLEMGFSSIIAQPPTFLSS
jgi:hypothetical protein